MLTHNYRFRFIGKWLFSLLLFPALSVLLLNPRPVIAAPQTRIVYVKPDAAEDNSGGSWETARGLSGALADAVIGDEIWVAAGVYHPDTAAFVFTFALKNGVAVYGGFAGNEKNRGDRNLVTHVTVLSGDIDNNDTNKSPTGVISDTNDIVGGNSFFVVVASDTDSSAVLDGFTITGGNATDPGTNPCQGCGGGLQMVNGNATLANLIFSGNQAHTGGGGMYLYKSSPTLTNITFTGNHATSGGGMFVDEHSAPHLTKITFSNNHADSFAGGMFNHGGSTPILQDATFSGNSSTYNGGGMANNVVSSPTMTNITFTDNVAGLNGGGIYDTDGSNPLLTRVTFSGNQADAGGGIYNNIGSPTLQNVAFTGNWATSMGGGVVMTDTNHEHKAILRDVLFSGNHSPNNGGALYISESEARLTNLTFSGNDAAQGGAVYNIGSSLIYSNTIIWNNGAHANTLQAGKFGAGEASYHSFVEGLGYPDPLFIRPVTCGSDGCGDNPAIPHDQSLNDDYGDLRLQPASPAIDAGDNSSIAGLDTDLAGQPRIVAAKVLPAVVDIGAYEAAVTPPVANAGGPYSGTEGSPITLNGLASHDDAYIVSDAWDCTNDGKPDVFAPLYKTNTCTYPRYGTFTVRLIVTDSVNATGTATAQVTVASVAPNYTPASNQPAIAGSASSFKLGSFTDIGADGTWHVTVNWGDGSPNTQFDTTHTGNLPNKNHIYTSVDSHNVVVTVNDGEAEDIASFAVDVKAPSAGTPKTTSASAQSAAPGIAKSFTLGSFTDPDSNGPWPVTIDWGDGTKPTHFSVAKAGQLPVTTHSYANEGAFDVTVTVSDGALASSSSFQVKVASAQSQQQLYLPSMQRP